MRVTRLVLGIITIIVSIAVFIFGALIGTANSYARANGVATTAEGGGWQMVLAFFFLAGGIVMIACHKKGEVGGCIACTVIYAVALIIGIAAGFGNILSILWLIVLLIISIIGIPVAVATRRREAAQVHVAPVYYYDNRPPQQ